MFNIWDRHVLSGTTRKLSVVLDLMKQRKKRILRLVAFYVWFKKVLYVETRCVTTD